MDSTQLFENVPTGFISVLTAVGQIFAGHWKPLVLLGLVQIGVLLVVFLLLGLITFGFLATYVVAIITAMSKISKGYGRHLIDYAFVSGTSRLLQQNNYYGDDQEFDFAEIFDAKFFIILAVVYVMWILVFSVAGSYFIGAFFHLTADIYAGNLPSIGRSLSFARTKMWSIYCFHVLIIFAISGLFFVTVGIPVLVGFPEFENIGTVVLGIFLFVISYITFATLMAAAIPSIVVERKPAMEAFKRSWELCKHYACYIFCTLLCFNVLTYFASTVANMIFNHLPFILSMIGHILIQLIAMAIGPIVNFVLYMSIRVRLEGTTQEELVNEIGSEMINGVEMGENGGEKIKGPYTHVTTAEVI